MLDIEQTLEQKFPSFEQRGSWLKKPTVGFLKRLMHEKEVNQFLEEHQDDEGFDFIDQVFAFFNFSYSASHRDRGNIPASGRVIIVANHPLGALDGLSLLKLVGEVRRDVKIVVNDMLMEFKGLDSLLLPVDNLKKSTQKSSISRILQSLNNEEAVIIFPAGEVSRIRPNGVRDGKWSSGFLSFAKKTQAPILPIYVKARNSSLFYSSSMLYKPLSSMLLAHEIFNKNSKTITFKVGAPIPYRFLERLPLERKEIARLIRRHAYLLGKGKKGLLETEQTIIHPRDRKAIKTELKEGELLGETADEKKIYLFDYRSDSAVMNEIGRLREMTFRRVGEGTGKSRDLDRYDKHYRHIVLWDEQELEIVGSYRLAEVKRLMDSDKGRGIYSQELFDYNTERVAPYFEHGIELGRSFVSPKYWGKRSLDHLWYGIGAYLRKYPTTRYLFGPVSLSDAYPELAKALIVTFYQHYFPDADCLATSRTPYIMNPEIKQQVADVLTGDNQSEDFRVMKEHLAHMNVTVPTLYKQYADLCDEGGVRYIDFNVDANFGHCIDGLIMTDMDKLKAKKRLRYIGG
ncbi:MAG: acyltransferase [Cycloclasticus sp. Phe_18]|jgi:putative hemolysin|nr:MAG: acyltransferase [Cycloclasticus sp. Phe_18]MDF1688296.1 lysophospholipid acyltransferase family protein [Cycloclasticus sp.]